MMETIKHNQAQSSAIKRNQAQSGLLGEPEHTLACNRRVRVRVMCDGVSVGEPRAREGLPPELVPDEGGNHRGLVPMGIRSAISLMREAIREGSYQSA